MAKDVTITVKVLAHEMFMAWCPSCLFSSAWCRAYLQIGNDATVKTWCLECGYEGEHADD